MKTSTASSALLGALSALTCVYAAPVVDEEYPYTGPAVPVGDWVDPSINGNGKGFPRLVEPPAVQPASANPTNNINVIALAYVPNGINIHYQTPFGLGVVPSVKWGTLATNLNQTATGFSHTYDRTPSCSQVAVTQCSQFFHEVSLPNLQPGTRYYYQIPAANGTTASDVLSFATALAAGDPTEFSVAVLNDMGYTNAGGTYRQLLKAVDDGVAFAVHGGDLSYADDWYSGILPCADDWPVCYNGSSSELPGGVTSAYTTPLPAGEIPNQGGPLGGEMSVLYESNWDLWQQWVVNVTAKVPYMVLPGNHEATCSEFDGPGNVLTAYLNSNQTNATAPTEALNYFSCPPSQRNFTAYQNRFRMPGDEVGGVGNFWYSFDYGLAHFVAMDGETDFANSPEYPFAADLTGNETSPKPNETYVTDSGPFGAINGSYKDTKAYAQYQWLLQDLAGVDRTKTPWVIAMNHRPMYSSGVSSYQQHLRAAFEALLLDNGVDAYISGHIHWYERLFPLGVNGTIDQASIINNNTYYTNPGNSMTHLINGMAGNIESHSTLSEGEGILNITAVLDQVHYGFSKLTVLNSTALKWTTIRGSDGSVMDELMLLKRASSNATTGTSPSGTAPSSSATSAVSTGGASHAGSVPLAGLVGILGLSAYFL
ncbi:purple acid phosphatase-3 [Coleophoma cylindrospora]|uniref:Purple acid phosphatase n=1 Tax=Coleophoma cylindrospora TaxID=1849047 RepID=A0A3D8Q5G8_9HELO|nr:purple acid phosphatase-3 [Coleophoma cylindrospora]